MRASSRLSQPVQNQEAQQPQETDTGSPPHFPPPAPSAAFTEFWEQLSSLLWRGDGFVQKDDGRWPGDARSDLELQGAPGPSLTSRAFPLTRPAWASAARGPGLTGAERHSRPCRCWMVIPVLRMQAEAQRGERLARGHRAAFALSLSKRSPPPAPLALILASQKLPSLQAAPPDAWLPWCRRRGGFLRSIQKYTPARPPFLTPSFQCQSLLLCSRGQCPFLPQQPRSKGDRGGRGSRK